MANETLAKDMVDELTEKVAACKISSIARPKQKKEKKSEKEDDSKLEENSNPIVLNVDYLFNQNKKPNFSRLEPGLLLFLYLHTAHDEKMRNAIRRFRNYNRQC